MAENLSEMAQIMSEVAGEVFSYRMLGEKKKRQVVQALRSEKLDVQDIYYVKREDGKTLKLCDRPLRP